MLREIYAQFPTIVQPIAKAVYQPYKHYRFHKISQECNGMLPLDTYKKLYDYAADIGEGNILEVGSAHGAGTISLGLGVEESNGTATVIGVEKGEGGSRTPYGTKKENLRILQDNIRSYGLSERVQIVNEYLSLEDGLPSAIKSNAPFSLVCLDADGRLDRDFQLLYDDILPGSIIAIDDYAPERCYQEKTERMPSGGGKHYQTLVFANFLCREGYLDRFKLLDDTLVAVKPPDAPDINDIQFNRIREHLENDRSRHSK